ncbi:hypothetical protein C4577_01775 [Candidatus Parcubacteria bacterium]|nr:MAG: hypothetical protein C4577_01775 [Candidatus Parcubacteria bacterium]
MITVEEEHLQSLGKRASIDGQVSKAMDYMRFGYMRQAIYALAFIPIHEVETKAVDFGGNEKTKRSTIVFHLKGIAKRLNEIAKSFED